MILANNGRNFTVPGKNLKVSGSKTIVEKDTSGQSSFGSTAGAGVKPQKISVAMTVPEDQASELKELCRLSEAKDSAGDQLIFSVIHKTVNVIGVNKVSFAGTVSVKEADGLLAWNVSFTLIEKKSVAERREERLVSKKVAATTASGEKISMADMDGDAAKKVLNLANKALP